MGFDLVAHNLVFFQKKELFPFLHFVDLFTQVV